MAVGPQAEEHIPAVLVVDNEVGMCDVCRRILSKHGYAVETANSGEEGLAKLKQRSYDAALVDLKMPGIDGIAFLQAAREIDANLVCIIMTGYATLQKAVEATQLGAYNFLAKPFTPNELLPILRKGLEQRSLALAYQRLQAEREASLLELSTEKSRLRTIINYMADGVLVTNREGQLVLTNPAASNCLIASSDEILGRPVSECLSSPELAALVESVADGPNSQYAMVSQEVSEAGGGTVMMAKVAPVRGEQGEIIGTVTVLRDITQLKQIDRLKTEFVRMVSHELRSPLASIRQYLDILIKVPMGDNPARRLQMLERCRERVNLLLSLISDLLDVSRLESGHVAKRVSNVSVAEVVREAVDVVRVQAEAAGVTIDESMPSQDAVLEIDRDDLFRVLSNLLSNAVKYNRPGGSVRVVVETDVGHLKLIVEDTGIGIPPEAQAKVFDEFFRVKSDETKWIVGTGLGLSIVKKIVDAYHGTVDLVSEVGRGTRFTIRVPRGNLELGLAQAVLPSDRLP